MQQSSEIIRIENKFYLPQTINYTNVITSLHQTGKEGEAKDGMDIALCVFDIEEGNRGNKGIGEVGSLQSAVSKMTNEPMTNDAGGSPPFRGLGGARWQLTNVHFSGANNPLYLIRKNEHTEYKYMLKYFHLQVNKVYFTKKIMTTY